MIEILFYLSLAATLFLLFLLINHLKTRIVTLETQNEGLMDIIKLLRGNMVTSDSQQKNIHDRLVYLECNASGIRNSENITLEIAPLRKVEIETNGMRNNKISVSEEDDEFVLPVYDLDLGKSEDDSEEEDSEEGLETIDVSYPTDGSGFIDIQKMNYEDEEEERDELRETFGDILELQGHGMSDIQKMMLMMSFGQGFPGFASSGFGTMSGEMEVLEEDYSDLPELVEDDSSTPVSEVVDETPVSEVVDETPVSEVVDETPVSEVVDETPVTEVVDETSEEELVDYHKLDVKTLRQMAQDLHIKENVKNMKKPEIIKLLSSQAKV